MLLLVQNTFIHWLKAYGVRVILHTDHAAKKLLPWIDEVCWMQEQALLSSGKPTFQLAYA